MTRRRAWWILAAIAVVILGVTSQSMLRARRQHLRAQQAFDAFAQALTAGRLEEAYSLCSVNFKSVTTYPEFERQLNSLKSRYGDLRSISRGSVEVEGRGSPTLWVGEFQTTLAFEKQPLHFTFWLREHDGSWELDGFEDK